MRHELLKYITDQSAATKGPQYPYGYMYIMAAQTAGVQELQSEGFVTSFPQNAQPDGSFPVVLTEKGATFDFASVTREVPQNSATQTQGSQHTQPAIDYSKIKVDNNIPMPESKHRGFRATGESVLDKLRLNELAITQSVHIPQNADPERPVHRAMASVVSQANKKFWPMDFQIREVGSDDPNGAGARIWRCKDLTEARPTRAKREKPAAAPAAQPQGQPSPGFGGPGFGTPPAGFPGAPAQPPAGFGGQPPIGFGGAPAPQPFDAPSAGPQGFAPGGPSFGG